MLNHLFATILICLGVANTTPISKYNHKKSNLVLTTPKKENIITNYYLDLETENVISQSYAKTWTGQSDEVGNPWINYTSGTTEIKKYYGTSNYLNVIGNYYKWAVVGAANSTSQLHRLYNQYGMQQHYNATTQCMFIKITPYNFNKDTKINLQTYIQANTAYSWEQIQNIYLKKTVYTTVENLDEYIGITTPRQNIPKELKEYITNVNNGFYYLQEETEINLNVNQTEQTLTDQTEITITPDVNNYIYIEYMPMIELSTLQNNYNVIEVNGNTAMPGTPRITGTNIIPDGTYEVVDIPGIMYEVIGMPFAFVSQAFNLTLFPGTPYQINIANLFLSIAAIFVFVWLLLLFIKLKG